MTDTSEVLDVKSRMDVIMVGVDFLLHLDPVDDLLAKRGVGNLDWQTDVLRAVRRFQRDLESFRQKRDAAVFSSSTRSEKMSATEEVEYVYGYGSRKHLPIPFSERRGSPMWDDFGLCGAPGGHPLRRPHLPLCKRCERKAKTLEAARSVSLPEKEGE